MNPWYVRSVFFVSDMERAIDFYRNSLGFSLDWNHQENGRGFVCQVGRPGLELILAIDETRAGRGRVFISIDQEQERALRRELAEKGIEVRESWWGMPTVEVLDPDANELLFSPPAAGTENPDHPEQ